MMFCEMVFIGITNESVPIQLAQCWFHGLAISSAKIKIYFSNQIYGSNYIEQHSETVIVLNYRNAHCSPKNKFIVSFIIIFGTFSFPMAHCCQPLQNGVRKLFKIVCNRKSPCKHTDTCPVQLLCLQRNTARDASSRMRKILNFD